MEGWSCLREPRSFQKYSSLHWVFPLQMFQVRLNKFSSSGQMWLQCLLQALYCPRKCWKMKRDVLYQQVSALVMFMVYQFFLPTLIWLLSLSVGWSAPGRFVWINCIPKAFWIIIVNKEELSNIMKRLSSQNSSGKKTFRSICFLLNFPWKKRKLEMQRKCTWNI